MCVVITYMIYMMEREELSRSRRDRGHIYDYSKQGDKYKYTS